MQKMRKSQIHTHIGVIINEEVKRNQLNRQRVAQQFKSSFGLPANPTTEAKHIIYNHMPNMITTHGPSSGITWVAVCGMDSICLVTGNGYLDMTRRQGLLVSINDKRDVLFCFKEALISEIEDLADSVNSKPFGVVSVCDESLKESPAPVVGNAITCLQNKFKSCSTLNHAETIKLAISAFKHLFSQEFTENDIMVTIFEDEGKVLSSTNGQVMELPMHVVARHLAEVNNSP